MLRRAKLLSSQESEWRQPSARDRLLKRTKRLKKANRTLAARLAERQRREVFLKEELEGYRRMFENAAVGICQRSPKGGYLQVNSALARMYGYESPQALMARVRDEENLYVSDRRWQELLSAIASSDRLLNFESQVYRQDGSTIWISENLRAVRDESGNLLYCESFITEITDRQLALEEWQRSAAKYCQQAAGLETALQELQRAQTQLVQSEKMSGLGQMVVGVAHEINNPLNFVCGNLIHSSQYASDLLELLDLYRQHYPAPAPEIQKKIDAIDLEFLQEDFPRTLSSMQIGADRIRQIVRALQNFSRLDETEMNEVDIHEGIDSTLLILHNRLKSSGNKPGIAIHREYGDLPSVNCYGGQLNQVFMNLLSNAIDALEEINEGQSSGDREENPSIITIRTDFLAAENLISISISDNGLGMTADTASQIFNPFFTTKPAGKGTGLGLSISYQIVVEKHGGQIICFSAPEQGTEFVVKIPV